MEDRLYMEIHALQAVPASCINRDDTGSPKELRYGGTIRGRVSSQAWKRAMRMYFKENSIDIGIRTRRVKDLVVAALISMGNSDDAADNEADNALKLAEIVSSKIDSKSVMTFVSQTQIEAIAKLADKKIKERKAYAEKDYKTDLKRAVSDNPASDMLLFGRMMANDISLNYDAASQVAHAFTVDEAREEYDYFTAVDDLPGMNAGAGHIDSKNYNSGVYYRYANVNLSSSSELIRMDKENAAQTAKEFLLAFVLSMPSGSANSYANHTLPEAVTVILRKGQPVNFAPAFLEAVRADNNMTEAKRKLAEYEQWVDEKYIAPTLKLELKDKPMFEIANEVEKKIQELI